MSGNGAQDGVLDDFEYPVIEGEFSHEDKVRPNKHNAATKGAVGKVQVRADGVIK